MSGNRENFSGRFALIASFAGSAIGLGNIWRFPYMVGEKGGAAFIVIYLLCSLLVAMPIFFAESLLGRNSGAGVGTTMNRFFGGKSAKVMKIFFLLAPIIVSSFYSVVGGWSLDYFVRSLAGEFRGVSREEAISFFGNFSSSALEPLFTHIFFLLLSAVIVVRGLNGGIEKFNKITVPLLFILIIVLVCYSFSLPRAVRGITYLMKPDFAKITPGVLASAMGQSFFSLSLGMGTILVYSSYMKKKDSIMGAGFWTVIFDTFFAVLAAFAIIPAVFSAGIRPNAGPSLVFETLPFIFSSMKGVSPLISYAMPTIFFFSILVAALTSEISMLEVIVEYYVSEKKMSRKKATFLSFAICVALGCLCSLSFGPLSGIQVFGKNIFGLLDMASSNFLMILGSLFFSVIVGWKMDREAVREELTNAGTDKLAVKMFSFIYSWIRYVIPVLLVIIFITNLMK